MLDQPFQLGLTGNTVQRLLNMLQDGQIEVLRIAPTTDNPTPELKIVIIDEEPPIKYNGYWYIYTRGLYSVN